MEVELMERVETLFLLPALFQNLPPHVPSPCATSIPSNGAPPSIPNPGKSPLNAPRVVPSPSRALTVMPAPPSPEVRASELQGSEVECRQVSLHRRLSRLSGHGPEQWAHPALLGLHRKGRLYNLRLRRGNHSRKLFPADEGEPSSLHRSHPKHLVQVPGAAPGGWGRQQAHSGMVRSRPGEQEWPQLCRHGNSLQDGQL